MHDEKIVQQYSRWGKKPPTVHEHGVTRQDILDYLAANPLQITDWHMEGNKLIGDTEFGPFVQFLPTDYILSGIDEKGLPILTKVVL